MPVPSVFREYLKTAALRATKLRVPAHESRIHIVCKLQLSRSRGQITKSGQNQMCTPGPASNLKIVGTVLVRFFSNFQDEILE